VPCFRAGNLEPTQKGGFMDSHGGVLVYTEDGTPYFIPTNSLAQFKVTGASRTALEEQRSSAEPEDTGRFTWIKALELNDVTGPPMVPAWPVVH
jgi:hypothetical protein